MLLLLTTIDTMLALVSPPLVSISPPKQTRFVLERALGEHKRLRANGRSAGLQHVVALSFSPGVTVEGLLLKAMPPDTQAFG